MWLQNTVNFIWFSTQENRFAPKIEDRLAMEDTECRVMSM